ncbi:hypothetical protein C1645_833949 [Glomus cerebriforme]|uniref:Uncharacterized protein n=1 Tax=Glomus cerebriforme TaxID=658196 RepID=A0A397SCY3_9GLOM|nr:hypothetical protein C1645_833949 [Glomus cerebriforme]
MTLDFRLNACPICLTCLDCQNEYGQKFSRKPLTQRGATSQKVVLDSRFVDWFYDNISQNIELSSSLPNDFVNICQNCMSKYHEKEKTTKITNLIYEKENCINLTLPAPPILSTPSIPFISPTPSTLPKPSPMSTSKLQYVTLYICQIEKEILSRTLPTEWGKIELGLICYQKLSGTKADHFDLKLSGAIMAFVMDCQKRKNIQLCVYSAKQTKRKQIVCGSSVIEDDIEEPPKKNRVLESSSFSSPLETTKLEIYKNLPKCEYHIQGCLISEDGRHLKLSNDMITIWARTMIAKIDGVDATHPPVTNSFDRTKYRYPNSRKPLEDNNNILSSNDQIPIESPIILPKQVRPNLITIHLKKKSPYKSNIQITKNMTFQDLINFMFPMSPPEGKRFITKSSLDTNRKVFLSEQLIEEVFFEPHIQLWIDIEKQLLILVNFLMMNNTLIFYICIY